MNFIKVGRLSLPNCHNEHFQKEKSFKWIKKISHSFQQCLVIVIVQNSSKLNLNAFYFQLRAFYMVLCIPSGVDDSI